MRRKTLLNCLSDTDSHSSVFRQQQVVLPSLSVAVFLTPLFCSPQSGLAHKHLRNCLLVWSIDLWVPAGSAVAQAGFQTCAGFRQQIRQGEVLYRMKTTKSFTCRRTCMLQHLQLQMFFATLEAKSFADLHNDINLIWVWRQHSYRCHQSAPPRPQTPWCQDPVEGKTFHSMTFLSLPVGLTAWKFHHTSNQNLKKIIIINCSKKK